jgi:uncharacterized membrane protein
VEANAEAAGGAAPTQGRRSRARHRREAQVEFNRIVAFSDGVFTIAITLLVLGLFIPEGVSDLTETLLKQSGDLFAYAISFAVIGRFWLVHHRFFSGLERFDDTLMRLNLLYLGFIGLVPFSSQVLGDYGDQTAATVLYALNMIAVTLAFALETGYAHRHGLIRAGETEQETHLARRSSVLFSVIFGSSIPVAFVSPTAASLMWIALFLVGRRLVRRLPPPR